MTKLKLLIEDMEDELCSAKGYAECYVEHKAKGDTMWANKYREMSQEELKHANYLHELIVEQIEALSETIDPPQSMIDKWEHEHKEYVEKAAWIKQMLTL